MTTRELLLWETVPIFHYFQKLVEITWLTKTNDATDSGQCISTIFFHSAYTLETSSTRRRWCRKFSCNASLHFSFIHFYYVCICTISYTRSISESDLNFEDKFFNETFFSYELVQQRSNHLLQLFIIFYHKHILQYMNYELSK